MQNPQEQTGSTARPHSRAKDSMRVRFAIFATALALLIIGLTSLNAYQIKAAAQERSAVTTLNLIRLVERQVYDTMSKVDIAMQTAAIEIDRDLASDDPESVEHISEFLKRQHALVPEAIGYRALDDAGNVKYGEGLDADEVVNLAEREYFKHLKENPDAKVVVFGPIVAQISKQWSVGIARALRDGQGHFRGAIVATIPIEEFQKKLSLVNLGESGAATLRMADMALVARATSSNKGVAIEPGSRQISSQLEHAISDYPLQGSYIAATAIDGIERVNAYMKVSNYPMYVIIGVATQDVAPEWRKQTILVLTLGLIAIAITALGATSIARQRAREFKERFAEATRNTRMLEKLARHDSLTGLPNRALLEDRYAQAIAQHLRRNRMLAVAFLDLDGFKAINDTYGHEAGDAMLVALSRRMTDALRHGVTLARLGGDEFVAIITDLAVEEDANRILQRLLVACSNSVQLFGANVQVSVSIGVAFAPKQGTELDTLLRKADQAMYSAKQRGHNQFKHYDE